MGLLDRWLSRFTSDDEDASPPPRAPDPSPAGPTDAGATEVRRRAPSSSDPSPADDPLDALLTRVRARLTLDERGRRYAEGPEFQQELRALDGGGRSRAADGLLADALLVTPDTGLRRQLAERLIHRGDTDEARTLLDDLQHQPAHATFALTALGEIAEADGEVDSALEAYERVLAIDITLAQPKARARRLRSLREDQERGQRQKKSAITRFLGARAAGGRYAVVEEIGRGGAATVFRARDRVVDREVALKIFHPRGRAEDRRARIVSEARIAASFDHPHIVPILDVKEERDLLVMQICDGGPLRQRLTRGRLRVAEMAELGAVLLRTLGDVHREGRVHLDIKPSNLLFHQGTLMLCDFGTAGLVELGAAAGTRAYMAPEVRARGEAGPPADLYATGLVLFECLTGHLPTGVDYGRPEMVLEPLAEGPVRRALEGILRALTDPDPKKRPTDAHAVARLLLAAAALPSEDKEGAHLLGHLESLAAREGADAEARLREHVLVQALRPAVGV